MTPTRWRLSVRSRGGKARAHHRPERDVDGQVFHLEIRAHQMSSGHPAYRRNSGQSEMVNCCERMDLSKDRTPIVVMCDGNLSVWILSGKFGNMNSIATG